MRAHLAGALCAFALVGAGCAIGDDEEDQPASSDSPERVETTRVQVVEGIGKEGGFDPREIYDRLAPGVVTVISLFGDEDTPLGNQNGGLGSGFVLDGDGYIATNTHVVTNGQSLDRARQVYVDFADGNRVPARIAGVDPNADVALLKIDPKGLSLTPLELGEEQGLQVGDPVAAIGSPFGEEQSLSIGVISALDRNIASLTDFGIGDAIQTDAAINRGNSGGPLLDAQGRVIGINAQIRTETGEGAGVGFAIPVDTVKRSLDSLRDDGEAEYGYLGCLDAGALPAARRPPRDRRRRGRARVRGRGGQPRGRGRPERRRPPDRVPGTDRHRRGRRRDRRGERPRAHSAPPTSRTWSACSSLAKR